MTLEILEAYIGLTWGLAVVVVLALCVVSALRIRRKVMRRWREKWEEMKIAKGVHPDFDEKGKRRK